MRSKEIAMTHEARERFLDRLAVWVVAVGMVLLLGLSAWTSYESNQLVKQHSADLAALQALVNDLASANTRTESAIIELCRVTPGCVLPTIYYEHPKEKK